MNKEQIEGKYEQIKGEIKKTWGKLTDDDIALLDGQQDSFYSAAFFFGIFGQQISCSAFVNIDVNQSQ